MMELWGEVANHMLGMGVVDGSKSNYEGKWNTMKVFLFYPTDNEDDSNARELAFTRIGKLLFRWKVI